MNALQVLFHEPWFSILLLGLAPLVLLALMVLAQELKRHR